MEQELEQFRQEVERLRAGRQKGSLPYPEVLGAFAVRYVAHVLETGGTFEAAATAQSDGSGASPRALCQAQRLTRQGRDFESRRVSTHGTVLAHGVGTGRGADARHPPRNPALITSAMVAEHE